MSGFVVAFGQPDRNDVLSMFEKIHHRGPYIQGVHANGKTMAAQNYCRADTSGAGVGTKVPVISPRYDNLRICYDGQMGNWQELSTSSQIADGPYREERLLLNLYKEHGKEMFNTLDDAIFAFVICDGDQIFAARDLLGIKTLFYGWKDGTLLLASELKSLVAVTRDVYEFPAGHYMAADGQAIRFAELPKSAPDQIEADLGSMAEGVRNIIFKSVRNRVDFSEPTASLLSGGMDSSVIAYLSSQICREKFGENARLKTFAMGVGENSGDIASARIMADHINSEHHEVIVGLDEAIKVLPEVIYYLENFDPSLVRSSVSNYLISKYAKEQGAEILLSGEGGDEIFCGYTYLKDFPPEELFSRQMECISFLHNNASLRLDRMNQAHSIKVVAPLISGELFRYTLAIPPEYKQRPEGNDKIEKWIFRKAYESVLPEAITWRLKQEFSQGSGSAALLPRYFEDVITDQELAEAQAMYPMVRSKEEFYYFRIFTDHFGRDKAVKTVGQWICL